VRVAGQVGLDRQAVLETAAALADQHGLEALTLAKLAAALHVRSQSLYAHVEGIDGLHRGLALLGQKQLADELRNAAMGLAGRDALHAIADAYRRFESQRPGLYAACLRLDEHDTELWSAIERVAEPLNAVLRHYGLDDEQTLHWYRTIWSAIHGFVSFQRAGLMNRPVDPEVSFRQMIDVFADGLDRAREIRRAG
jgi:AcrR family transcriptional regulator